MKSRSVARTRIVLACAAVMAFAAGCSGEDVVDENVEVASDATVCSVRSAGAPWWNASFAQQTGRFYFEVTATPSASNIDAVVGLSRGVASRWTQLAAIVRFAPSGVIDVRSGGTYAADVTYSYTPNTTYVIRMYVDVNAHTYSVAVQANGSGPRFQTIASNYPFRTEQAAVTALDNAAVFLEPTRPGSLTVCDQKVVQDDSTIDGCVASTANGGFANMQLAATTGALIQRFYATPSVVPIDGVVGFTSGRADDYNDFVASVRFFTNGIIEARDGDTYRATTPVRYIAGRVHSFVAVIDLPTRTYSVFVEDPSEYGLWVEVAHAFKFRTQQANAVSIDNFATIVASTSGTVTTCNAENVTPARLASVRADNYSLAAASRDGLIALSQPNRTQIVDNTGRTYAEFPAGGTVSFDDGTNIFYAKVQGSELVVSALGSSLAPRWERFFAVAPSSNVMSIGAYASGDVAVAVDDGTTKELIHIRADGIESHRIDLRPFGPYGVRGVAISRESFAISYVVDGGGVIESHAPTGELRWQRSWTGAFDIEQLAADRDGGVVFGGTFYGPVDFGTGLYEPYSNPEAAQNTYLVSLSPQGGLRFTKRLFVSSATSIATNGQHVALAATEWTQIPYMELYVFDRDGNPKPGMGGEHRGFTGSIVLGSDGKLHANMFPKWHPSAISPTWPMLYSFSP